MGGSQRVLVKKWLINKPLHIILSLFSFERLPNQTKPKHSVKLETSEEVDVVYIYLCKDMQRRGFEDVAQLTDRRRQVEVQQKRQKEKKEMLGAKQGLGKERQKMKNRKKAWKYWELARPFYINILHLQLSPS